MNMKRKTLTFFVLSFMVLLALFITSDTHAYWIGGFAGSSEQASAQVSTGVWNQAFEWDPNATYSIGDRVINNGVTYEARRDNPTREPGVGGGWRSEWTQID